MMNSKGDFLFLFLTLPKYFFVGHIELFNKLEVISVYFVGVLWGKMGRNKKKMY